MIASPCLFKYIFPSQRRKFQSILLLPQRLFPAVSEPVIANTRVSVRQSSFHFIALVVQSSNGETKVKKVEKNKNKTVPNRDEPCPARLQLNSLVTIVTDNKPLSGTRCSACFYPLKQFDSPYRILAAPLNKKQISITESRAEVVRNPASRFRRPGF
jgi:hypothetical protein